MDRNDQHGNAKPTSMQQSWWVGGAKRQGILLKFIIVCVVIALIILGVVMAVHP
jgi:hypothetical protein